MTNNTELKQKQFVAAMEIYENRRIYKLFGKIISTVNIMHITKVRVQKTGEKPSTSVA